MRSSKTHCALDRRPPLRFTVSHRAGVLALHDTRKQREHVLFSARTGNRHGFKWRGLDAHALADWLNERDAGYPKPDRIEAHPYDR